MDSLIAQKTLFLDHVIGLRQQHDLATAAAEVGTGPGRLVMAEFHAAARQFQGAEQALLSARKLEAQRSVGQSKIALILGTVLGLIITAAAGFSVHRDVATRGRVEAALRDSDEAYRMLVDGVQDYAIIMLDPHGKVVTWNSGAERIKGYSVEEAIGKDFSAFFSRDDIERGTPAEILRTTAATGRYEDQAMRLRKDGSRFFANISLTALRDADGELKGFSDICRDLSETKEAGAKYRGLLEAAPDAMVVVNQAGEIVLLNVQAEKQFGYRRDELLGQKVTNIIPEGFAERLIADDLRSAEEALDQQIGTGIELTGTPQGRQRVSDRDHAQPARQHRRNAGDGGDPRHQRAQGRRNASRSNGRTLPRPAGSRARRDGRCEPGR